MQSLIFDAELRSALQARLAEMDRRSEPTAGLKRAAVALVVVSGATEHDEPTDEASIILTRRAMHLRRHRGQFALPGGRIDPGETAIEGALRELHEEVGLELGEDRVLGLLDDYVTRSGYHMTAVVVWGAGIEKITPNPDEVAAVYRVPLGLIADPKTQHLTEADSGGEPVLSLAIVDTLVFAPTAAVMLQLGRLASKGDLKRVHHFEEPRFAWE